NPLVQGSPFIRFYAGCPLVIKSHAVGTLCISDRKPRDFSDADTAKLVSLAHTLERLLGSIHDTRHVLSQVETKSAQALATAP
ncbi:MAG: GAF domain-containing protein, partial [Pseudomonadota bacterium]